MSYKIIIDQNNFCTIKDAGAFGRFLTNDKFNNILDIDENIKSLCEALINYYNNKQNSEEKKKLLETFWNRYGAKENFREKINKKLKEKNFNIGIYDKIKEIKNKADNSDKEVKVIKSPNSVINKKIINTKNENTKPIIYNNIKKPIEISKEQKEKQINKTDTEIKKDPIKKLTVNKDKKIVFEEHIYRVKINDNNICTIKDAAAFGRFLTNDKFNNILDTDENIEILCNALIGYYNSNQNTEEKKKLLETFWNRYWIKENFREKINKKLREKNFNIGIYDKIKEIKNKADNGDREAIDKYFEMILNKIITVSEEEKVKYCKMIINRGRNIKDLAQTTKNEVELQAIYEYGVILCKGIGGIPKNEKEAIDYFYTAMSTANSKIKENITNRYFDMILNNEIPVNDEEKKKCYKMEIEKGNSVAMNSYALLLENSTLSSLEDKIEAIYFYKMAIGKGNKEALKNYNRLVNDIIKNNLIEFKSNIGEKNKYFDEIYFDMILNNEIPVNDEEKKKCYKMEIEKGNSVAMNSYALLLENSTLSSLEDKIEAIYFYKMAIGKGNKEALKNYNRLVNDIIKNNLIELKSIKGKKNKYFDEIYFDMILNKKISIDTDEKESILLHQIRINNDDKAMYEYANMLYIGKEIPQNVEYAIFYYKKAADKGNINAIKKCYDMTCSKKEEAFFNKEEKAKYYKMAADLGNISAMNNYANALKYGYGIPIDKLEAIEYYKKAIDLGNTFAMNSYATTLANGDGIPIDREEAIKYYKMAINRKNVDFILTKIPNKEVFKQLFRENNDDIINILKDKQLKCEFEYNKNKKIKTIKIKNLNDDGRQGKNQVETNRELEFDGNGNLSGIKDIAYHKDTNKKLYEIKYNEKGERSITYFDPDNGNKLVTATINEDGIIKFNNNKEINLENLEQKTNEILNSFNNNDSFDNNLSYLRYASLQLQDNNIVINTKGNGNIDNVSNIINSSLNKENKNKMYICDFVYHRHCIQLLISNGNVIMDNTGLRFDTKTEKNNVKMEIEETIKKKLPPEKAKQLIIAELVAIDQKVGNCVLASKIDTTEFVMKIIDHNQKHRKLIEESKRLIKEKRELLEKSKQNLNKFKTPEQINSEIIELEKRINKSNSKIIELSEVPKYLNEVMDVKNLIDKTTNHNKKVEALKKLEKKHLVLLKIRLKAAYEVGRQNEKHFENIAAEFSNLINKINTVVTKETEKNNSKNVKLVTKNSNIEEKNKGKLFEELKEISEYFDRQNQIIVTRENG